MDVRDNGRDGSYEPRGTENLTCINTITWHAPSSSIVQDRIPATPTMDAIPRTPSAHSDIPVEEALLA
jgi:hypothetical protein